MNKEGFLLLGLSLIAVLICVFFVRADNVTTQVNISNSPPYLSTQIPNQSWAVNQNLTNAFDLDNYFLDNNGDSLIYYYTLPENISVLVDSNNLVSFYPDESYLGVNTILFYAGDGGYNATSNLVYLNVGVDDEAPKWSTPLTSLTTIYQNSHINFSILWTDNVRLKNYSFYINQGGGFSSSGSVDFSGIENTSIYSAQISASGGSVVYWYFCAADTTLNENCTDIQNISVTSSVTSSTSSSTSSTSSSSGTGGEEGEGGGTDGLSGAIEAFFGRESTKKTYNFSVEPNYFKISLKQGASLTRTLKVSNIGNQNISINLLIQNVQEFITLSDEFFSIDFGKTKVVTLDFGAKLNTPVGQYNGVLLVNSSSGSIEIPIVIDINARVFDFEVKVLVFEEYKSVKPGEMVLATISIINLKDSLSSEVNLYYAIKDLYGNIYDSSEDNFLLDSPVVFQKNLTLPKEASVGDYIFYARASYFNFSAIDSDLFESGSRFNFKAFFQYSFFIILIIVLSAIVVFLFLRYRRERDKERLLNLYLMLNEMKKLIKEGKVDSAVNLYIRIKSIYGEPVSKTALENKEKLKEEITKLSLRLKKEVDSADEDIKQEIKESKKEVPVSSQEINKKKEDKGREENKDDKK